MSERIRKVNSLIQHELTELMTRELDLKPGLFITVSAVDTTPDLRYTRVSVRVYPATEHDYAMQTLEHERITLQKQLHKKLHLKILPKVSFDYDPAGEDADELESLMKRESF